MVACAAVRPGCVQQTGEIFRAQLPGGRILGATVGRAVTRAHRQSADRRRGTHRDTPFGEACFARRNFFRRAVETGCQVEIIRPETGIRFDCADDAQGIRRISQQWQTVPKLGVEPSTEC